MRPRTEQTRLLIAIAASVLLHALGIVVFAGSYGTSALNADHPITARDDPHEITLGIERSDAQTVDWIGYDEYRKHVVAQAPFNQALMAIGGAAASAPAPEITPQPQDEQQHSPRRPDEPAPNPARTIAEILLDRILPDVENAFVFAARRPSKTGEESERSESQPTPAAQPGAASPESSTPDERPGNADKDADAVSRESVIEIKDYVLGQPLAVEGLDIKTIRPEWSVRTRLLARPRTPVVRIHFNRAGKVVLAILEQSTGEPDVDRPLLDAIYQWRAVGERLGDLSKDDPESFVAISITIQLR
ncbi:MAG: hypothetical protein H6813_02260 [Phycisphaeraceae bacterium]|nr:hypothetical protein [Phycisphaeraceae bacterium]MCB9848859.1 hypothetical protein [Phycisphaeraceae bacterium]